MWDFLKTTEFWVAIVLVPVFIARLSIYFSFKAGNQKKVSNKAGDLIIRAGDAGPNGNGGNVYVGPGTYKAGDAIQKQQ